MTPWCVVLVRSWRRLLADRHSLPFSWTLSLHRRWCPSASHHPLTFLFLCALPFPLPFPFPSLCLSLRRPHCPSALHQSFPFHSLGRLCQRSPWTCPVSLPCVESTQRKANAFAVGQVCPTSTATNHTWWNFGHEVEKKDNRLVVMTIHLRRCEPCSKFSNPIVDRFRGAYHALCARCAKSWLFSTTGSSVSSED